MPTIFFLFLLMLSPSFVSAAACKTEFAPIKAEWLYQEGSYCEAARVFRQEWPHLLVQIPEGRASLEKHRFFCLLQTKQLTEAEEFLEQAQTLSEEEILFFQALCSFDRGKLDLCIRFLRNPIFQQKMQRERNLFLFICLAIHKNAAATEEVQTLVAQLEQEEEANTQTLLCCLKADLEMQKQEFAQARMLLRSRAMHIDTAPPFLQQVWHRMHTTLLLLSGEYAQAGLFFLRDIEETKESLQTRTALLSLSCEDKKLPQNMLAKWLTHAESLLSALGSRAEDPDFEWESAKILRLRWKYLGDLSAKEKMEKLCKKFQADPEKKGEVGYWQAEMATTATQKLCALTDLLAQIDNSHMLSKEIVFRIAFCCLELGQVQEAQRHFLRAVDEVTEQNPLFVLHKIEQWVDQWVDTAAEYTTPLLQLILQKIWDEHPALSKTATLSYLLCFFQDKDDPTVPAWQMLQALAQNKGPEQQKSLISLARLHYHKQEWKEAESVLAQALAHFSDEKNSPQLLLWAADCADRQEGKKEDARQKRIQIWTQYPSSEEAAPAYFQTYALAEYGLGEKEAIKHLEKFPLLFPDSPLTIFAQYLLGLDFQLNRKNAKGKIYRKRNIFKAIDAFQQAERSYQILALHKLLAEEELAFYEELAARCGLERARANQSIAQESVGSKKQIYQQYAEELLLSLLATRFSAVRDEAAFSLGELYLSKGECEHAEEAFSPLLLRHPGPKDGYRTRIYRQQAAYALQAGQFRKALLFLEETEHAAPPQYWTIDETLQNWIDRSTCYRLLGETDHAMQWLSKVINQDFISGLRVQAMCLRAELYEEEGRYDLARKQWEATAEKGGPWGSFAKQKLDTYYAHHQ